MFFPAPGKRLVRHIHFRVSPGLTFPSLLARHVYQLLLFRSQKTAVLQNDSLLLRKFKVPVGNHAHLLRA